MSGVKMKLLVLLLFGWICPEIDAQTLAADAFRLAGLSFMTIANSGQSASSEPSNALVRAKRSEEQKQKMLDRYPDRLKKCCEYGFRYSPRYVSCEAYAENALYKAPQTCRKVFRDCCLFLQRHRDSSLLLNRHSYDDYYIGPKVSEEPHTNHSGCTMQDFQQSDVFDENFDVSVLKQSYDSGSKVEVPCKIGFRGFIELLCSNGQWIHHGSKCRLISCGFPGHAQFADVQLIIGTDYDFGAQVLYTCHKGYQMTSRTDTRNCLLGGWDGQVPVCEPILCPSLSVDNNVLVYGDLDHPISGSVLQFNCSSREALVGPTQIVCDDNGNWDNQPPTCREISFPSPEPPLKNSEVEGEKIQGCTMQDFQQSDVFDENFDVSVLKQSYDSGSKVGVPCKIGFRGFIELLCSNGQWFHRGSKCRLISCGFPGHAQFADVQLIIGTDYDFGAQVLYTCHKGYQMTSNTATLNCLLGGWDGQVPVCEPILCPSLSVDNNVLVYGDLDHPISGSVLQFNCSSRKALVGPTQIVCDDNGNWDNQPPTCRDISFPSPEPPLKNSEVEGEKIQACSSLPTFEHAFVPAEYTKAEYYKGDVIYMSCDPGYTTGLNTTYMCTERSWRALTIGQCIEMDFFPVLLGCAPPPPLKNGRIFQPFSTMKIYVYVDGQRVHFQCDPLYRLTGGPHITCSNGQWIGEVQCLPK